MWIEELLWDDVNIDHIAQHKVSPVEVDEAIFEGLLHSYNHRRLTIALAQAASGRYLTVVLRNLGKGKWRPITARDMNAAERRLLSRHK